MTEEKLKQITIASVALTCEGLSDQELATLNLVGQANWDPHNRVFDYERVKGLFTEKNGTRMHQTTKDALVIVVLKRLASSEARKVISVLEKFAEGSGIVE